MGSMTDEAKENMVMGQRAMRAVDAYLNYLDKKPVRRRVKPADLERKIEAEANLAHKVILIAQMHEAIRSAEQAIVDESIEDEFVKYSPWFSQQHNITYAVWREMGVPSKVLSKAGITS